jgi:hypothetical protein
MSLFSTRRKRTNRWKHRSCADKNCGWFAHSDASGRRLRSQFSSSPSAWVSDLHSHRRQVSDDAAKRSSEIHWRSGFSPDDADLFAHNEIFIKAPASAVWRHLVEAQKWPEWYPNSQDVQIVNDSSGVLKADSKFQWSTFGLHITSTIHEFLPNSRLGWFGKGTGVDAVLPYLAFNPDPGRLPGRN